MTARQHVAELLKSIPELHDRVYFVDRPSTATFPCVIYNQISTTDQQLVKTPGVSFAGIFRIEAHVVGIGDCEKMHERILLKFQTSDRFLNRDFLPYETEQVANETRRQLIYKAISNYIVRE